MNDPFHANYRHYLALGIHDLLQFLVNFDIFEIQRIHTTVVQYLHLCVKHLSSDALSFFQVHRK